MLLGKTIILGWITLQSDSVASSSPAEVSPAQHWTSRSAEVSWWGRWHWGECGQIRKRPQTSVGSHRRWECDRSRTICVKCSILCKQANTHGLQHQGYSKNALWSFKIWMIEMIDYTCVDNWLSPNSLYCMWENITKQTIPWWLLPFTINCLAISWYSKDLYLNNYYTVNLDPSSGKK